MKNILIKIIPLLIIFTLLIGCRYESKNDYITPITDETSKTKPDSVRNSAQASDETQLINELGEEGSLNILVQNDITTNKDLEIKGDLSNASKTDNENIIESTRNLILYNKDNNGNVSTTYKIKAPKLTIKRENTTINYGIFEGDIYIDADNFTLYKTKVNGNVYFITNSAKDTFKLEEGATVTGEIKLK